MWLNLQSGKVHQLLVKFEGLSSKKQIWLVVFTYHKGHTEGSEWAYKLL